MRLRDRLPVRFVSDGRGGKALLIVHKRERPPYQTSRLERWVIARRAHHYDHVPRNRLRYNMFEFVAGVVWGRDTLWDSRTQ